jgi:hypothetical protein
MAILFWRVGSLSATEAKARENYHGRVLRSFYGRYRSQLYVLFLATDRSRRGNRGMSSRGDVPAATSP